MTRDESTFEAKANGATPAARPMIEEVSTPTSRFATASVVAAAAWSLAIGGMIVSIAVLDSEALFQMLKWVVLLGPPIGMLLGIVGLLRRFGPNGHNARLTAGLGIAWNAVGVVVLMLLMFVGRVLSRHGI